MMKVLLGINTVNDFQGRVKKATIFRSILDQNCVFFNSLGFINMLIVSKESEN